MNAWSGQRDGRGSRQRRWQRLAVALVCAWGLLSAGAIVAATPGRHTVVIEGTRFEPETLTVKRGETVMWINKDPFPHTVTAAGEFDSHDIPPNRSWRYKAQKPGEYAYSCTLHPNMTGTLKVE
ncbi:MAG: cupredoxin family copper-binding protein [Thiobacillaceae bacterium]